MSIVKKILNLIKPYRTRIFFGIILSLIVSGITGAIAWAVKPAIDEIVVGQKYEYFILFPLGVFFLFAAKGLFSFGQLYLMKSSGMKLVRDTRNRLYSHILYLPTSHFHKESSGALISRVMYDVETLHGLISEVVKTFILEVPTVLFLLGVALYRKWDLTLLSLILLPLLAYSTRKFGKGVKKKRKEAQRKLSFLTQRISETIHGARIIKVFNREEMMAEKFRNNNQRFYREMLRVIRLKEFTKLVIDIVTGAGIAVALGYGFYMIMKGTITVGVFGSILAAIYFMFSPIKKLGEAYSVLQESRASLERIDTVLNTEHEKEGSMKIDGFRKSICFENVSFVYPGNATPVLSEICFEITQGEVIAIVGRSGVGKSTLVDLIPRFHIPTAGQITLDGIAMNSIELHSLREQIGIVSQDIILFNDTVRENIAFGKPGASDTDIIEAAKKAYADEFIQGLPDTYQTIIGERGLKLSGGQRQRIAIARAILKNPPVLILDEATSSLDSVSEAIVQQALDLLMKGRTTIVIAHRLSTIRNADRILVLDKGRIADIGTHEELIERNNTYRELYQALS